MEKKPRELLGIALRVHLKRLGHGALSVVASDAGMEQPKLSKIKKGSTIGSVDDWHAIASALNTTYNDMLELGRQAIEDYLNGGNEVGESITSYGTIDPVVENHIQLIPGFKNKSLALSINQKLLKIEKLDPKKLETIDQMLDGLLKAQESDKKKLTAPSKRKKA